MTFSKFCMSTYWLLSWVHCTLRKNLNLNVSSYLSTRTIADLICQLLFWCQGKTKHLKLIFKFLRSIALEIWIRLENQASVTPTCTSDTTLTGVIGYWLKTAAPYQDRREWMCTFPYLTISMTFFKSPPSLYNPEIFL